MLCNGVNILKRILFLIPTLSGGGAEKVLVNLVNNLDRNKYSIKVMTLFDTGVNKQYLKEKNEYMFFFNRNFRGSRLLFKLFSPKFLFNLMIKEEYDVIVSFLEGPTTRIVSGCNNEKTKIVNWIHNEFYDMKSVSKSYRSLKETIRCYKKFSYTVFVAESAKDVFPGVIPLQNKRVLYNIVETEQIREMSLEKVEDIQFDGSKINLVSVGRFTHQKGYERLLEVINKLIYQDKINLHLYLIGQGELKEKYLKIINERKISDNVTLLEFQKNPYKYVKKSDLFICSSYYEGFSTVVTESLIIGTPVVTTLCSGMKELLGEESQYGTIVENSEQGLYSGLRRILKDKSEIGKLKERAIERGKSFNKSNTIYSVESFFDNL